MTWTWTRSFAATPGVARAGQFAQAGASIGALDTNGARAGYVMAAADFARGAVRDAGRGGERPRHEHGTAAPVMRNPALRVMATSVAVSMAGTGMWAAARVIYLLALGISPAQVGAGLLVTGLVGAALAIPVGRAVDLYADRQGRRRATILLLGIEGVLASLFALVDGFTAFIVVACAASIAERACAAAAGTLIAGRISGPRRWNAAPRFGGDQRRPLRRRAAGRYGAGDRERRCTARDRRGERRQLPARLCADEPSARQRIAQPSTRDTASDTACKPSPRRGRVPARYAAFGAANALMTIHDALLPVALPLWVAGSHLVPAWSVGGALFLNSALVGVLQLPASRRVGGDAAARITALIAGALLAVACAVVVGIEYVPEGARLVALVSAVAVYTVAELAHASCAIYLSYSLAEPANVSACRVVPLLPPSTSQRRSDPSRWSRLWRPDPQGCWPSGSGWRSPVPASRGPPAAGRGAATRALLRPTRSARRELHQRLPEGRPRFEHRVVAARLEDVVRASASWLSSRRTASSGVIGSLPPTIWKTGWVTAGTRRREVALLRGGRQTGTRRCCVDSC